MALVPMTKLDAVNAMLIDIGERTVSTLSGSLRKDVQDAITTLDNINRAFQARGWWFNRDRRSISINGSSKYAVPTDIAYIEVIDGGPTTGTNGTPHLVERAGFLFDTINGTDTFSGAAAVNVLVHTLLDFADLPAVAKEYVYASASVRFQSRVLGSPSVNRDLVQQAGSAWSLCLQTELDNENYDQTYSPHFFQMMHWR